MKKTLALILAIIMLLSLAACGGGGGALVGRWQLSDGDGGQYGYGVEFKRDGTMAYAIGGDIFAGTDMNEEEWNEAMEAISSLYTIKYKVKSDTRIDITVSALLGLGKETSSVEYSLTGDTLVFDGSTYVRAK